MNEILSLLNSIEASLKKDINEACDCYGDHTDDAELYVGQLREEAERRIDDLLDQYDPDGDTFRFESGKWVLKSA